MSPQHFNITVPLSFKQVVEIVNQLSPTEKRQLCDFLKTENSVDDIIIPEEQKQIVRERIKKYEKNPGSYLSWGDIERKMADRK